MGVLSNSARKAYKIGARRAHVPEWFLPASYVFGGIIALVLVLGVLFGENPRPLPSTESSATDILVIGPDGTATSTGLPSSVGNTTTDTRNSAAPTASTPTDATESLLLLEGGTVVVPGGAWSVAQNATFALLTGDFTTVTIYPGKTAPILLTTWNEPSILGLVSFEVNADDSLRFVLRVDPDATGEELARDVPILLAAAGNGWAYLPG